MAAPTWRERVHGWGVQHPTGAALIAWAVPILLLLPVLVLVASKRDNSDLVAMGLPMLLAGPTIMAAVLFGVLKQERDSGQRGP